MPEAFFPHGDLTMVPNFPFWFGKSQGDRTELLNRFHLRLVTIR